MKPFSPFHLVTLASCLITLNMVGCTGGSTFSGSGSKAKKDQPQAKETKIEKTDSNLEAELPEAEDAGSQSFQAPAIENGTGAGQNTPDLNADNAGAAVTTEPILPPAPIPTPKSEVFLLSKAFGKVNLIWVLDNSGSMQQEATYVKENMDKFLQTLEQRSDVTLALVSDQEQESALVSTRYSLPEAMLARGHRQVVENVKSANALRIVQTSFAAPWATPQEEEQYYEQLQKTYEARELQEAADLIAAQPDAKETLESLAVSRATFAVNQQRSLDMSVRGKLTDFYSNDSRNVLVVVTDDESDLEAEEFIEQLSQQGISRESFTFFAFAGTTPRADALALDCRIARQGVHYQKLAEISSGKVFDICATDWQVHFDELAKQVVRIALTDFNLTAENVTSVSSVKIDGRPLDPSLFTVVGKQVKLNPEALDPETDTSVEIDFLSTDP